nr:EOG090X00BV [Sida crystallina]
MVPSKQIIQINPKLVNLKLTMLLVYSALIINATSTDVSIDTVRKSYAFPVFFLIRILFSISTDTVISLLDSTALTMTMNHGGDYAVHQLWSYGSRLIIPLLVGMLMDYIEQLYGYPDYSMAFVLSAILALVATPLILKMDVEVEKCSESMWTTLKTIGKMVDVISFFLLQMVIGTCWMFHASYSTVLMDKELASSKTLIGPNFQSPVSRLLVGTTLFSDFPFEAESSESTCWCSRSEEMDSSNSKSIHLYPEALTFGFHTSDDIKKFSVVQVSNPQTFNTLGHPMPGGLYDLAMGPWSDRADNCTTCHSSIFKCPGHYGHIELPLPVYHPLFLRNLIAIIKLTCPVCKSFFSSASQKALLVGQLKLLEEGLLIPAQQLKQLSRVHDESDEEDEDKEKKDKKTSKSQARKVVDQKKKIEIEAKVQSLLEENKVAWNEASVSGKPLPTRHVESQRQQWVNDFQKQTVMGKCSKCSGGWSKVVLYKSRIVFVLKPGTVSTAIGGQSVVEDQNETIVGEDEEAQGGAIKKKSRRSGPSMPTTYLTAQDAREHLREVWANDQELFGALFPVLRTTDSKYPTDVFFLDVIPVIPSRFRPINVSNGLLRENGQSLNLKKVIEDTYIVKTALFAYKQNSTDNLPRESERMIKALKGKDFLEKYQSAWLGLQESVNIIVDGNPKEPGGDSFRQMIEKKQGIFRMNMMGKRVNYAARSVITPDPNIEVEEVGIPEIFAKKLTFPTPVTAFNVQELRELVRNGPNVHPGAVTIEEENGRLIRLSATDAGQREAAAKTLMTPSEAAIKANQSMGGRHHQGLFKPKIVHRHMQNGDIMLLNRQPTLHKPSIMAHKARILPGEKTLRLHYANCKAFNADFDGDEMNAHLPQNQVARSEGYNIVAVPHQYLVPKDGTPLTGLIQDHMIAGVKLTIRGRFFNRADYMQLVYAGLGKHCSDTKLLPPAIIKPVPLWSGKQILSTVIMNLTPKGKPYINMLSTAKISIKNWQNGQARPWKAGGTAHTDSLSMSESQVVIRQGELLCGVLDKMHYGATSYGLVHSFFELYGGHYSCTLLTAFGRLFTTCLQLIGFTLGVKDILLTPSADKKRTEILAQIDKIGKETAARAVGMDLSKGQATDRDMAQVKLLLAEAHLSRNTFKRMTVDHEYRTSTKRITDDVNKACIPNGLLQRFPDNNLDLMIQSGAKGTPVNSMQMTCLLGQIELEGKRPPMMVSGRSLPSFLPYDTSPRAGGFIGGRFMTGIRPQEFFYHCMAGREGLIDTAVKTSRSGYLQRCLIKHLEGICVAYDGTVRDSDGSVIQFLYGEDGLDIGKSQYLNDQGIPFLVENRDCVRMLDHDLLKEDAESRIEVKSALKKVKRWARKRNEASLTTKERKSGFLKFSTLFEVDPDQKEWVGRKARDGRLMKADQLEDIWRNMEPEAQAGYARKQETAPDPVNAHFPPTRHADVVTERLQSDIDRYLENHDICYWIPKVETGEPVPKVTRRELTRIVHSKTVEAAVEPGEPVGILAAQSIGEPSTQMTLNTFHFAGRGDMNVTLGIPRLREILMTASTSIKTPSMDIPLLMTGPEGVKKAERLKLKLTRVTLADVLEKVEVSETVNAAPDVARSRIYTLTFHFLPRKSYRDRFCVMPTTILSYFETVFIDKVLLPGIGKEAEAQAKQSLFEVGAARPRQTRPGAGDDDDVDDEKEADKSEAKGTVEAAEDEDADSDADVGEDAGASGDKQRRRMDDQQEYEDEEDDEAAPKGDAVAIDDGDEGFNEDDENEDAVADEQEETVYFSPKMEEQIENRKKYVLDVDNWIRDYEYDVKSELWCRLTLSIPLSVKKVDLSSALRGWAEKAVVHQVPKIKRAFVVEPKKNGAGEIPDDGVVMIKTDGVNIQAMFKHSQILDLNRLYCNDVHQIAMHYGVDAASQVLVKEIRNVFKVYGITVDLHHLSLVASYMTAGGSYRPFNRHGMKDSTAPLQQMSFETATDFLKSSTLQGKTDYLQSPSSRLVLGLPGLQGTGSFGLLYKLY